MNAQWDRNPKGQDRGTGLGAKHDGPVAEGHAPKTGRELPLETVERQAEIIFEAMRRAARKAENGNPPEWVPSGNSTMQEIARRAARDCAAIASMGDDGLRKLLVKVLDYYEGRKPFDFHRLTDDFDRSNQAFDAWQEIAGEIEAALARTSLGTDGGEL